jgi:hypothetical protein
MRLLLLTQLIFVFLYIGFCTGPGKSGIKFPDLEGWNKSQEIQVYSPENLYEYINGAADFYLTYNFEELQVIEYRAGQDKSILAEVYRHKTAVYAFGIYSHEKPESGTFLDIGAQGYYEDILLNFLAGKYYVKLNSYNLSDQEKKILPGLAEKLAAILNTDSSLPEILGCFPTENKIQNSEKFIARNFLGYDFFNYCFVSDYGDPMDPFTVFIIETKDSDESKSVLKKYFEFIKHNEQEIKKADYSLKDPYHGDISISWQDRYIWGIIKLADFTQKTVYLGIIRENLKKRQFIK